jgi:hypothetical protein
VAARLEASSRSSAIYLSWARQNGSQILRRDSVDQNEFDHLYKLSDRVIGATVRLHESVRPTRHARSIRRHS